MSNPEDQNKRSFGPFDLHHDKMKHRHRDPFGLNQQYHNDQ